MKKILILALSGIGDAIMFTPSIVSLREIYPDAQIDSIVMIKGVKDLYETLPEINKVFYFNFMKQGIIKSLKFVASLRGKYDYSINVYPSNRKEYNIINFLIGSKKRAGFKYLRKDFANLGWLNNVRILEDDNRHNVESNIKLVEKLTDHEINEISDLQFPLNAEDEDTTVKYLEENSISINDLIIGIHPGCAILKNHIKRRWEPGKFAELSRMLINNHNAKILIFGGPDEEELKKEVKEKIGSNNAFIIDTKTLTGTAALIKRCKLFVTNDSSLMHTAAAMKVLTAAVIGPTNINYIHPWHSDYKIISLNLSCSPCFIYSPRPLKCFRNDVKFKCIKELTVDYAYNQIKELIIK